MAAQAESQKGGDRTAEIELTEKQEEVIDWMMGCPIIERWSHYSEIPEQPDFYREYDKPELEDGVFRVPKSEQFINIITRSDGELQRYADMADEAGEVSSSEAAGIQRTVNNLKEKLNEVVRDE